MIIQRPEKPRQPPTGQKPALVMVQLPIFRVKRSALEKYLFTVFHMDGFDFLLAAGIKVGECPEYIVRPELPNTSDHKQRADDIRRGYRTKNIPLILNVLCVDGYIPAGKYIIDTHPEARPIDVYTALMKTRLKVSDPDCVEFRKAYRNDRTFMAQAAAVDKLVAEAVENETLLLGKRP